jgi:hypothetical protein
LKDLIIINGSKFLVWFVKPCLSQKNCLHHIGAIFNFVPHYNYCIRKRYHYYPSPLWGAGKVEDTYNLLGHALRKAVSVIAAGQGQHPAEIAELAGAPVLNSSSLKTALDLNWDEPGERQNALLIILNSLFSVE